MKKIISFILALSMLFVLAVPAFAADYKDTAKHWAEKAIDEWSGYGIVKGEPDSNFYPDRQMTRAEAGQIMVRLLKLTEKADISKLTDVKPTDWYADAVAKCVAAGILKGVSDTEMDPNGTLTREMFFVMFARALGIKEEGKLTIGTTDMTTCSPWAAGYVNALLNNGYIHGMDVSGGKLVVGPTLNINRSSAVGLLDQTVTTYAYEDNATIKPEGKGIILVVANNVTLTDVPAGTTVVTGDTKGTTVNGEAIDKNTVHIVGEKKPDPKPEHEHKFGDSTATCTTDGVKTCECGATEVVKATGHIWKDGKCALCGATMEESMKFELAVASGESTVKMTVFDDYSFIITVPAGTVNAATVEATVKMQNVGSLGVGELRSHTIKINTGITGHEKVSLQNWLSNAWTFGEKGAQKNTLVNVDISGKTCAYAIYNAAAATAIGTDATILGVPQDIEATRAAWHALTANIKTESGLEDDSYIVIKNGSYLVNGTEKLCFEDGYKGDLKLDNFSKLSELRQTIKDAVKLETVEGKTIEGFLKAGTQLKVSSSSAVLTKDAKITIDTTIPGALEKLRTAANTEGNYALAEALVSLVNGLMGSVQGKTVNVAISFS